MPPFVTGVGNVKLVFPVTKRSSPALSCNSAVFPVPGTSPTMEPPMVKDGCGQMICTFVMLVLSVPVPLSTVQVCAGLEG